MLSTAIDQAAAGISAANDRLGRAAGRIARSGADAVDANTMVDLALAPREAEANAAVVRTADEMIGTLLDVLA